MRERNQRVVLQQVLSQSVASRAGIAKSTGLTRASVSELVAGLINMRLVREIGPGPPGASGGKPPTLLTIDPDNRRIVSIDASAEPMSAAVLSLDGSIVARAESPAHGLVGNDVVYALRELIATMRAQVPQEILAVAVGTPGVVQDDAVVVRAANFGWANRDLASELRAEGTGDVLILNDAQAAALAEYSMATDRGPCIASVLVGGGVGAGFVLNGRLFRGESSSAGEIGHLHVGGSRTCSCGQKGCLETVTSLPSLLGADGYAALRLSRSADDVADVFAAVSDEAWARAARGMGTALAAVTAVLDVGDIVLGGPIAAAGHHYLERIRTELHARLLPGSRSHPTVRYSQLKEDSVLLGVASFALHQRLGVGWTSQKKTAAARAPAGR